MAAGAFAVALLTFVGAVWPSAPGDEARAPLAFAVGIAGVGFLAEVMLLAAGFLSTGLKRSGFFLRVTNGLAAAVFLVTFVVAGIELNVAMNAWFETPPRMSASAIFFVRFCVLGSLLWLVISAAMVGAGLLRRLVKS